MLTDYKEAKSSNSINEGRFPTNHYLSTNLKKIYTVFAWGINSARAYLHDLVDNYRFYRSGKSLSNVYRNFPDDYEPTDGASDEGMIRLARSMNINENTFSRIFFEWESKFLPKTSAEGIQEFVRLFFKYELIDRFVDENTASKIGDDIEVEVLSWYDSAITSNDNVYFYDDSGDIKLYLEVRIPKAYGRYFIDLDNRISRLNELLYKVVVPTSEVKFIEIGWI